MGADRRFDAVLFDLEGTLVDFQWRLDDAVEEILTFLAGTGIPKDRYGDRPSYAKLYNTTRDMAAEWPPGDADRLFEGLSAIYETYDRDALSRWNLLPGAQDILKRLSKGNCRMGLVSNCGAHSSRAVLKKYSLLEYFETIVSRNDTVCLKPCPEGLELALNSMAVSADRALFVGDSVNDIRAARSAAMPSCFLLGGESLVTGEYASKATYEIKKLEDIACIIGPDRQ